MSEWIKHDGAIQPHCPVHPDTTVDFKRVMDTEPDEVRRDEEFRAGDLRWSWTGKRSDIIAYRVVKQATSDKGKVHGWIVEHLSKTDLLPKPVDQLTEDEAKIFKIAVQHHAFLIFLREWLSGNPSFNTSIDHPLLRPSEAKP